MELGGIRKKNLTKVGEKNFDLFPMQQNMIYTLYREMFYVWKLLLDNWKNSAYRYIYVIFTDFSGLPND